MPAFTDSGHSLGSGSDAALPSPHTRSPSLQPCEFLLVRQSDLSGSPCGQYSAHIVEHFSQAVPVSPKPSVSVRTNCRHRYPNPGYQGASSHVAIFSQLSQDESVLQDAGSIDPEEGPASAFLAAGPLLGPEAEMQAAKIAECLRHLLMSFRPDDLQDLVTFWRGTGANLALAEPLVDICRRPTLDHLRSLSSHHGDDAADPYISYTRTLLINSSRPLLIKMPISRLGEFCSQFIGSNARLETLGLVFCAVIRAASEARVFPALYVDETRRQELVASAVKLTDVIVEIILSFDMLNDLQLIMQYENFISHSYVFGVQCKPDLSVSWCFFPSGPVREKTTKPLNLPQHIIHFGS